MTQESLVSTRRENDELHSRMQDLQGQLDKLNKLIQLKDAQLARLQGELGQAPAANAAAPQPAPATPANVPAQPSAATPPPAATPAPATPAAPATPVAPVTPPPPAKPATPPPAAKPPVVAPAPVAEEESLLDDILGNPILLGAIAGSFVLVLLLLLLLMRRRAAQKEETAVAAADDDHEPPLDEPLDMSHDSFAGLEDDIPTEVPVAAAVAAAEQTSAQTSDPLGEADIYIAYGRFNQAAELLQGAIYDEPNRSDLRLKLMEVFAEIGDRDGFVRQEAELREMGGSEAQIEQLKLRYPSMVVAAASAAGSLAAADALDDFNLDDLAFDTHDEPAAPAAAPEPVSSSLDDAFDLGLDDLSFEESATPSAPAKNDALALDKFDEEPLVPSSKADDDFAFDLDLDAESLSAPGNNAAADEFSLDLPETEATAADDFLLDLKDDTASLSAAPADDFAFDLGEEEAPAKPEQPAALPDDFDLSLPDDTPAAEPANDSFAAQLDQVSAELDKLSSNLDEPQSSHAPLFAEPAAESASSLDDLEGDDDFDFLSGADEATTKLDLARAYIDMGDSEGARDILDEVIAEGNDAQQKEAREMIERLS
ncbi:MAG: hypothetical protein GAK44_00281 [Pseudomonas delhiensis]|nr:MAG: hypothetical protein GAK44_00281 [Pseudomonas delhiensis]